MRTTKTGVFALSRQLSPSIPMSQSAAEHRSQSPQSLGCAVVTVSDTRTIENDTGGQGVIDRLLAAGHT